MSLVQWLLCKHLPMLLQTSRLQLALPTTLLPLLETTPGSWQLARETKTVCLTGTKTQQEMAA